MIYIVVPTYNRIEIFNKFMRQIKKQTYKEYKLVVVDHGKKKTGYHDENVVVLESDVNGWAYAVNIGLRFVLKNERLSVNDSVLVINDDVLIEKDYLQKVANAIKKKPKALIGSICYDWDSNELLHVNMIFNAFKAFYKYENKDKNLDMVKGAFFSSDVLKGRGTVLPVAVLKSIGLYAEDRLPHYRADHELAWRAKQRGYEVCVCGDMQVGAVLDSPHTIQADLGFRQNYKNIFSSMISTSNSRDLWNYTRCCFVFPYGMYYFLVNWLRSHVWFLVKYFITKAGH